MLIYLSKWVGCTNHSVKKWRKCFPTQRELVLYGEVKLFCRQKKMPPHLHSICYYYHTYKAYVISLFIHPLHSPIHRKILVGRSPWKPLYIEASLYLYLDSSEVRSYWQVSKKSWRFHHLTGPLLQIWTAHTVKKLFPYIWSEFLNYSLGLLLLMFLMHISGKSLFSFLSFLQVGSSHDIRACMFLIFLIPNPTAEIPKRMCSHSVLCLYSSRSQ